MKETKKVLFRIESSNIEGCETSETKIKKFEDYKALLVKDGAKIIEEKEVQTRRGKFIEITYA